MSYRTDDLCQPCGECSWCRGNWKAKRDAKDLRVALRKALRQVRRLACDLDVEATLYVYEDDGKFQPHGRRMVRAAANARRVAARLEPLTRARR